MDVPLQITFRDLGPSETLERTIRERAAKLDRFCDQLISCRVIIEPKYRHHHQGNAYHIRIDLTVPGQELVVSRDPGREETHEDAYVAVRDAFDAAVRQLEDYARRRRHDVKTHVPQPRGRILELNPAGDGGTIEASDGRLIDFHRNSVVQADFDRLEVGDGVRFVEQPRTETENPRASTVVLESKPPARTRPGE